ncbi:MAG: DUF4197 domain-containing protein [Sideroxydans sp.]|nr:DUF4197 domain-containing protein [Sideroxydans sp.]
MNIIKLSTAILFLASSLQANALDLSGLLKEKLSQTTSTAPAPAASAPAATSIATTTPAKTAVDLSMFSNKDKVASLKQALTQGAQTAVKGLSQENGFLGNDKVRIPMPDNLKKIDATLRQFGMSKQADELVTSMNRAAEAAVPEAQKLLVGAISKMSVTDATNILTGNENAATQYFRTKTEADLATKFQPIVARSMQKVQLAEKYDQFAGAGVKLGMVDAQDANLNNYITRKAMDGLFVMIAEQEKNIRANPAQAAGNAAKKIFGALLK